MAMPVRIDQQRGMFDAEWEDEDLEAALIEWIGMKSARTAMNALTKRIKDGKERNGLRSLEDGTRVRVGSLTFEAAVVDRDSFEVGASHSVRMKGIRPIAAQD